MLGSRVATSPTVEMPGGLGEGEAEACTVCVCMCAHVCVRETD